MRALATVCVWLCSMASAIAQLPTVSTGLFPLEDNPSVIELRVKANAGFDGLYSGSAFTVSWDMGTPLRLDSMSQPDDVALYHPISMQGPAAIDMHHTYQKFAGFGMTTLATAGRSWAKDSETVIMRLHVSGSPMVGEIQLIEDQWTSEENADHYQELNGQDRTGSFYPTRAVLNVDLAEFEAKPIDNRHAWVNWTSAGEYALSHYDILRSTNLKDWSLVATIPAEQYKYIPTEYVIMDHDVHQQKVEEKFYYMLRAVSDDGQVTDYDPIAVNFGSIPVSHPHQVYPNPAIDFITMETPAEWGDVTYIVSNDLSQQVRVGDLSEGGGIISLKGLPANVLMIRVFDANGNPMMNMPIVRTTSD